MGTTADKLRAVLDSKNAIKEKFRIQDNIRFRDYAQFISNHLLFDTPVTFGIINENKEFQALSFRNGESYAPSTPVTVDQYYTYSRNYTEAIDDPFRIVAKEADTEIVLNSSDTSLTSSIYYRVRGNSVWNRYEPGTPLRLSTRGAEIEFVNRDDTFSIGPSSYYYFTANANIQATGNLCALLNYAETVPDYAFYGLFQNCTHLIEAPNLPSVPCGTGAYTLMLAGTSISFPPLLPLSTLSSLCYCRLFQDCKQLGSLILPATTLADGCYDSMCNGCTALRNITVSFTTWGSLTNDQAQYTFDWLRNVPVSGTFTKPSTLADLRHTAENAASYIPEQWTIKNI